MRIVIFGLTVTSSWGNGHATTWRALLAALERAGHEATFFERDVPYYAAARDLPHPPFCSLELYEDWAAVLPRALSAIREADIAIVTSFCPDGVAAGDLVLESAAGVKVFYDIDTPRTLEDLADAGHASTTGARYVEARQIPGYDLYLSFTGGPTLRELERRWRARRAVALYCSVDPALHRPVPPAESLRCALGYLGTYSADRQAALERLLLRPAERLPHERFVVAGSSYPEDQAWPRNVALRPHLPPAEHASFYCANRVTLNVTRAAMARVGYSPSVRLFEAAACGTPLLTDDWPGLADLFTHGAEILVAQTTEDALAALGRSDEELRRIAAAARERVLTQHTADARARELVAACGASTGAGLVA
ncbi:glycosyltransferase [soil metagenome]